MVTTRLASLMLVDAVGRWFRRTWWPGSELQRFDLRQHVLDARAHLIALFAQRGDFGGRAFAVDQLLAQRADLVAERPVLRGQAGALAAHLLDHRDELADLLFEAFDGVEFDALGGLGHGGS